MPWGTLTFTDSNPGIPGSTLTWSWPGSINQTSTGGDCVITVKFWAQVNAGTTATTPSPKYSGVPYSNKATFATSSPNLKCENGTVVSVAPGSNNGCQQTAPFDVKEVTVLNSQKWIANPNIQVPPDETSDGYFYNPSTNTDNDSTCPTYGPDTVAPNVTYTRLPCVAKGYPVNTNVGTAPLHNADSNFNYKLVVTNTGNIPGDNYYLYDILPHVGDVGSGGPQKNVARKSQFAPYLTGPVVLGILPSQLDASNVIVEYNTDPTYNPDRPQVGVTTANNTWVTSPANFALVTAFRIRFTAGATLKVGDEMVFEVPMQIPSDAQGGEIAWNSFAQTITDVNGQLPTAEPRKVGIMVPKRMSIGNRVWYDSGAGVGGVPNNGFQDGSEPGIANVAVTLYQDNAGKPGAVVASTTTDANGYYLFDFDQTNNHPLDAGSYIVGIDSSNWTDSTKPLYYMINSTGNYVGTNDQNDRGVDNLTTYKTAGIFSKPITLSVDGQPTGENDKSNNHTPPHDDGPLSQGLYGQTDSNSDLTQDFGFFVPMSIGNRVWRDDGSGAASGGVANDGVQNGTEPPIAGVTVDLLDSTGAFLTSTQTDSAGYYRFDNLKEDTYKVRINASNWTTGLKPLAGLASSTGDFNNTQSTAATPNTTTADKHDMGKDDASFPTNGASSPTNGIVSGPIVLKIGSVPLTTETDISTGAGAHGTYGDDHDNLTVDFGFTPTYSVGNRVWRDNGNGTVAASVNDGLLDSGETGIDNVKLNLYAADGSGNPTGPILQSTSTSGGGYYRFDGLLPYSPTTSPRYVVVLDTDLTNSPGLKNTVPSDPTFTDLTKDNQNKVKQTLGTGTVLPGGLASPSFGFPGDAVQTESDVVAGNGTSVNSYGPNGNAYDNLDVDFGFVPTYSIGNRVWRDDGSNTNVAQYNDGKLDGTEVGLKGVKLNLYAADGSGNPTGSILQSTTTDDNGYYRFDGLLASSATISRKYVVVVDTNTAVGHSPVLISYTPSQPRFTDKTIDNENMVKQVLGVGSVLPGGLASPAFDFPTNALITETDVTGGSGSIPSDHGLNGNANDNLTADFGFYPTFSIGNRLWYDTNNNGHIDLGESPVIGALVDLFDNKTGKALADSAGNPMQAKTDANGYYRFDGLLAGDYYVVIDKSNWVPKIALNPAGPLNGYASSTNNIAQTGANTPDSFDNGIDDTNPVANGIKSPVITLGLTNEPTTDTDTAGPVGNGAPSVDAANNVVGDYGNAYDNLTVDFGFYKLSVGDTVWNDNGGSTNNIPANANNGKQDANEPGIPGVIVQLFKGGAFVAQATTDGSGNYIIDQQTDTSGNKTGNPLAAGNDYTIGIPKGQTALKGFESSTDLSSTFHPTVTGNGVNADDNGKGTSSADTADTVTDAFLLNVFGYKDTAGAVQKPNALTDNPTLDFGFHQVVANTYSIGNRVWLDDGAGGGTANNGIQDGTEQGLDGVRVLLYSTDASGKPMTLVQTQTTTGGGYYRFDSVPAGTTAAPLTYMVIVDRNNSPILNGLTTSNNTYTDYSAVGDKQNKGAQTPLSAVVPNGIPSGVVTLANLPTNPPQPANPVKGEIDTTNTTPFGTNGPNGDAFDILTLDFGFYQPIGQPYSIGNRVWLDNGVGGTLLSANDGIQNGNETGIPNVKVDLFAADKTGNPTGTMLQTQQTDGNGYYRFDNIDLTKTGNYYVVIVDTTAASSPALAGLKPSTPIFHDYKAAGDQQNKGTTLTVFPPGVTAGVISDLITITNPATPAGVPPSTNPVAGENDVTGSGQGAHSAAGDANDILTADFGFYSDVTTGYSIGNRVWLDNGASPNDGIQQADEKGLQQVPLKLFAADASGAPTGSPVQTISTDANGYYRFDGVTPGSYVVVMDLPSFNASSVTKYKLTGASFTNYQTDQQNVGKQTALDTSSSLPGGIVSPLIVITNPATPAGTPPSTNPVLNEKDVALSGLGTHGPSGDDHDILSADFALVAIPANSFSIGNRVWLDNGGGVPANANNGKQDAGEPGIPSAIVQLYTDNGGYPGTLVPGQVTTTDNSGYYRFDGVAAGKYIVVIDTTGINTPAPKNPALNGLLPSTPVANVSTIFSTIPTQSDQYTKGIAIPVAKLPAGITSGLASGVIDTATAGTAPNEPDVVAAGAGAHGPLGDGSDILTVDFGFYADPATSYSIGNRVWFDNGGGVPANANNGKQDANEPGIPNVKLELFYADKAGSPVGTLPLLTTTTDANGYYRFDGITPGDYVVVVDKVGSTSLNGFTPSTTSFTDYSPGGDQQNKGLITPLTQTSPVPGGTASSLITIAPPLSSVSVADVVVNPTYPAESYGPNGVDHNLLTADFSYITAPTTYSIGNRVWNDLNKDGIQQSNESGIGGVKVWLYNADATGLPTTPVGSVTTDSQGFYRFDGLAKGNYLVIVDVANSPSLAGSTLTQTVITTPNTNTTDAENNGIATTTSVIPNGVSSGLITLGLRPSEPIGELVPLSDTVGSVFTINNAPQSSDDHGNLTIDFGFVLPAGAANVYAFDPVMVKLVDPSLALPGEPVTFTITISNFGTVSAPNVIITDPLPSRLIFTGADTPQGSYSVKGTTVTFLLGTLTANQVISVHVHAKIDPNVTPPIDLTNTATATLNGVTISSTTLNASATLHVTGGTLPGTGEHANPANSSDLFAGMLLGLGAILAALAIGQRRQAIR